MKKILISFLCVITLFATCFGIMQVCETNRQVKAESVAVENEELFKMHNGAAFRLYWSTPNCGIAFGCQISNSLVEKYNPKLFIVPYDYITEVLNGENTVAKTKMQYGDYKGAIVEAGKDFVEVVPSAIKSDGYYELVAGIKKINDSNVNRKFFGVYYYEKGTTRVYADVLYDNPLNNSRSMAYVTSSSWYDQWSKASYYEEMHTFWMDKAIARAAYKADVTDATPASLSYSSPALGGSTKYSDTVRKDRVVFVSNTTNYGGQDGVSATYYDDLFTYDLVLSYIADDGKGNYSSKNVIVTENLDFKVKVEVTSNGKNYVSYNDQTGYISVKNTTSSAVEQGVKTWVGIGDPLNQKLVINSFDLNAKSSYVDIDTKDQYYEDFDNQPSLYKPFSTVTIKADGVKRIYEKSYTTIPTYTNNGRVTQSGQVAMVTISGDGTNVVNSATGNFTIYGEDQRVWKLTLHHKNVNGVTIKDDTVINFNASGAKDFGGLKGYIYDETLTIDGVKSVKSLIADICSGNNKLEKQYLPNLEWVEGFINSDTEITILYSPYDTWQGDVAKSFESGSGTKEDPFIIKTGSQLAYLSELAFNKDYGQGQYYKLAQSLDMSNYDWVPICFDDTHHFNWKFFFGDFDGNGYTIKLKIDVANEDGSAKSGAVISTLNTEDALGNPITKEVGKAWGYGLFTGVKGSVHDLTMMGSSTVFHRTGIITYLLRDGGTVENINSFAEIRTTRNVSTQGDGLVFTGGIVGAGGQSSSNTNGISIINCNNYGNVTSNYALVGGVIGEFYTKGSLVKNCNNYGTVIGGNRVGGIAGRTTQNVENCTNYGNVILTQNKDITSIIYKEDKLDEDGNVVYDAKGNAIKVDVEMYGHQMGGVVGQGAGCTVIDCVNFGNVYALNSSGTAVGDKVGGIVGYANRAHIQGSVNYTDGANYGVITAESNFGSIFGVEQDTNDTPNDEYILKFVFLDENGKMIWDYKNVSMKKGAKYNRSTDVGIILEDPKGIVSGMSGVTYVKDSSGNNTTKVNRGPMEALIKLIAYYITVQELGEWNPLEKGVYLPDRYWAEGYADCTKEEMFKFTYADVWDGSGLDYTGTLANIFTTTGGDGNANNPYQIETAEQLANISALAYTDTTGVNSTITALSGKYFILKNSIYLGDTTAWQPIGFNKGNKDSNDNRYNYVGLHLDGKGYTIGGLYYNNTDSSTIALIGHLNGGSVKNLTVQGNITSASRAGGICYYAWNAKIDNCKTFMDITTSEDNSISGALCGTVERNTLVTNCETYGSVVNKTTNANKIGGLSGAMSSCAKVVNCVNYANVTGGYATGGVVGHITTYASGVVTLVDNVKNYGTITGTTVTGSNVGIGGVIGWAEDDSVLNNLVNYGAVTGTSAVGSVIGYLLAGATYDNLVNNGTPATLIGKTGNKDYYVLTINYYYEDGSFAADSQRLELTKNSIYNKDTTFTDTSYKDAQGNYKTFTTISPTNITGYLPDKFWVAGRITQDTVLNVYYSKADTWDGSVADSFAGGDGTKNNPYLIETAEQLAYMSTLYSKVTANYGGGLYFKLVNSIDLTTNYDWTPIGLRKNNDTWYYFEGNFDGNGKTIANMSYSGSQMAAGLFSCISGTVNNLVLQGDITVTTRAGGLCYYLGVEDGSKTASISNITSFVNVTATSTNASVYIGGVVGTTRNATLTNCNNYGGVTAKYGFVGGITSQVYVNSLVTNSNNFGTLYTNDVSADGITGANDYMPIGGISGDVDETGKISNSSNYGSITGEDNVGGITAYSKNVINNCYNYGTITGLDFLGGIAGELNYGGTITYSYNYGVVTGKFDIGGAVGRSMRGATIDNVQNHGDIIGSGDCIGGIVGEAVNDTESVGEITISNCKNFVEIYGESGSQIGGIVGRAKSLLGTTVGRNGTDDKMVTITSCVNNGDVFGSLTGEYFGGIVGLSSGANIYSCTNNVTITAGGDGIGGICGEAQNASYIKNCHNQGDINDTNGTGATVGTNNGSITGYLGGMVDAAGTGSILESCTTNNVKITGSNSTTYVSQTAKNNANVKVKIIGTKNAESTYIA